MTPAGSRSPRSCASTRAVPTPTSCFRSCSPRASSTDGTGASSPSWCTARPACAAASTTWSTVSCSIRHRLRPVGVVVARRERARGYHARQREHREQRRSRELGDGRAARGSARSHRAPRRRRPTLSNLPARPASARPHRHSCGVPSPWSALGAPPAESARVDLSAPGADAVGRVRSAMKVARC